jgi:multiple sugar transport system permease protein
MGIIGTFQLFDQSYIFSNGSEGLYISYWNYIMAASMVFTLPVLVIYAFFNRYFVSGMLFTGTKG